jgi:site-specific DNA-methyltransferase (adenine-specific)
MDTNVLYYGDNLDVLRKHIPDESIDLVYLDPPFNSNANYNVLFKEPSGKSSQAQMSAFEDTWHWGMESEKALQEIVTSLIAPAATKDFMSVLPNLLGKRTDMSAYITMMCIRLIELRRVLKETGSIYLHCDPTASHYLKLLLDTIFGAQNFRSELIWKRTHAHSGGQHYGAVHDTILFYSKSSSYLWNKQYVGYSSDYKDNFFRFTDPDGRAYRATILTGSGIRHGSSGKPWRGIDPTLIGRHWAIPGYARPLLGNDNLPDVQSALERLDAIGRILWTSKTGGTPSFKQYLDDMQGVELQDIWNDIPPISSQAQERLGYPTQKPEALLERIIQASSNEGDIVLDPFCGCGTAVVVAQKLNRKWIGIDVTHLAIGLMKWRLKNLTPPAQFTVVGEPKDLTGAVELAKQDKYQFQWWAVAEVGGQPYGERKKGADSGIDGYLYYMDEKDKIKKAIISVKGGHNANVSMIRDLGHVIAREKADIGVFISIDEPTRPMTEEASMKGFYQSPQGRDYPRIQILTIDKILQGKRPDVPQWVSPMPKSIMPKRNDLEKPKLL